MNVFRRPAPLLVIEDNDEDFEIFSLLLSKSGAQVPVLRAKDAEAAWLALESANESRPELIVLDLNLPGQDGRALLKRMKSDPAKKEIPVVVLTTSASARDVSYCYGNGASAYLVKPVDLDRFEELVGTFHRFWFREAVLPAE